MSAVNAYYKWRDKWIFEEYLKLRRQGESCMNAYSILAIRHGLSEMSVRRIVASGLKKNSS